MDKSPDILFYFVRDMIYDYTNASLDIECLDEEDKKLGEGLIFLSRLLHELRDFAKALSKGDLSISVPSRQNELAAPLKALHASLRHIAWQSQQVAKGDYNQRVDFMGEFADAFNSMTQQLDARQRALKREIEAGLQKTFALEQSNSLLTNITAGVPQMIIVIDKETRELLYRNNSAAKELLENPSLLEELKKLDQDAGREKNTVVFSSDGMERYFSVIPYSLQWGGFDAKAFLVEDVSEDRVHVLELEKQAYCDELTSMHNRFYGMNLLYNWLEENARFTLCFVDLDYLKYVNDNFGHLEGDQYIIEAANLLKAFSKETVACRIGGDEFMLLNRGFTMDDTTKRMEELCAQFRQKSEDEGKSYYYCMSYGVVEVGAGHVLSAGDILSLADERMYTYKREQKKKFSQSAPLRNPPTGDAEK